MKRLKCENGCGAEFEIDEKWVESDEYIECPFCGQIYKNPLKKK